jgi:hypothetical protein
VKNRIRQKEENDELADPNEVYSQMLELYTMLPPFPFKKKKKKDNSNNQNQTINNGSSEK